MNNPVNIFVRKMYLEARLMMQTYIKKAYPELIVSLEQMIKEYETFRSSNLIKKQPCEVFLESLVAGLKLIMIQSKLRSSAMKLEEIDLEELKQLTLQAYKCRDFPYALEAAAQGLVSQFLEHNYYGIARVYMTITLSCIKMSVFANEDKTSFLKYNRIIPLESFAVKYLLNDIEIEYLTDVFEKSAKAIMQDNFETEERDAQELNFDDILITLQLKEEYEYVPKLVRSFKQAEKLAYLLNLKLDGLEQEIEEILQDGTFPISEIDFIKRHIFYFQCRGVLFYELSIFQKNPEEKLKLIEKSMNYYNTVLNKYFKMKADLIRINTVFPNKHTINVYNDVIDKNSMNYQAMISYKMDNLVDSTSSRQEIQPKIQELNILLRDIILMLKTFLQFADESEYCDGDKISSIFLIGRYYRLICLKNTKNQEANLKNSIPYIVRFIRMAKNDAEVYKSCGIIWTNNQKQFSEMSYDEIEQAIDNLEYIRKFRNC